MALAKIFKLKRQKLSLFNCFFSLNKHYGGTWVAHVAICPTSVHVVMILRLVGMSLASGLC